LAIALLASPLTALYSIDRGDTVCHSPQESSPRKLASNHLPNPIQVRNGLISGGLPESPEAFEDLRDLGVQTILSVDGAQADLAMAQRFSMRYVHIPHGYDCIPPDTIAAIAKTLNELPGPIYIHCHHGKHRSPAAAAAACIAQGTLSQSEAIAVLQLAGTNRAYRGLFDSVANAKPIDPVALSKLRFDFPATCDVPALVDAMVELEKTFANLDVIAVANWKPIEGTNSIDAAHQAVLLLEHFEELLRLDDVQNYPRPFRDLLKESQYAAQMIQSMLNPSHPENAIPMRPTLDTLTPEHRIALGGNWKSLRSACTACHQQFRDAPK
jgi:protein tyrosine phosphatase (PTP) superfamily phosphohydrolase (DUF442 family)